MLSWQVKLKISLLILFLVGILALSTAGAEKIKITYWQYFFKPRVETMDKLIEEFESQYPNIDVEQQTFPYEQFQQKVASTVPAGVGPDIVTLYYGWMPKWVLSGYLQPLPEDEFPPDQLEKEFSPLLKATKIGGKYWGLPTAVRTLALFYNKDILQKHGIETPPSTLEELVKIARECTEKKNGKLEIEGFTWDLTGQGHQWYKGVLTTQFGGRYISEDRKKILLDTPEAIAAMKWYAGWSTETPWGPSVSKPEFYTNGPTAFLSGHAALHIDGSFRIDDAIEAKEEKGLNFGVTTLPSKEGIKANFGSYWTHGITRTVKGEKLDAAVKFLKWITSKHAMELWIENVGELPAKVDVAMQDKYLEDPIYGPFVESLPYSEAIFYVDEFANREATIDAFDKIGLKGVSPEEAASELTKKLQKLIDDFWKRYEEVF